MSDKKKENERIDAGNVTVSQDVIVTVIKDAMTGIEGVHSLTSDANNKLVEKIAKKVSPKSDSIKIYIKNKNEISIEIGIILKYGSNVIEVSKKVQEKIKDTVESVVGMPVKDIDVTVDEIYTEEN